MNAHEMVHSYTELGWLPIPLVPGTKKPAVKFKHLTDSDCALPIPGIAGQWKYNPSFGCAVLLRPSGLLVVDCDSKDAVMEAMANTPEPCNNVVLTTKGAHFYYRRPDGCPALRTVHRGASGKIDILANGYMVAPPSVHPSGTSYKWLRQGPLQDAPDWAIGLLSAIRERSIAGVLLDPSAVANAWPTSPEEVSTLRDAVACRDARVVALLTQPAFELGAVPDRSTVLWLTMNTLIRLGSNVGPSNAAHRRLKNTIGELSDESIAKVIWFGTLGSDFVGIKPRERGWQWFCDEIARARLEIVAR